MEFPGRGDHPQHIADALFGCIAWLTLLEVQLPFGGGKCNQSSTGLVVHRDTYQVQALVNQLHRRQCATILGSQPITAEPGAAAAVAKNEPAAQPLSTDERAKLQKELERWNELKQEERGRIEDRLKTLPESEEREQLVKAYGRQVLGLDK